MGNATNKCEFTIVNLYSRKSSRYGVLLALCMLLATLAAIFIKTGNRLVLPAVFGAVMAVLIILNYREIRKTSTLIVADDKLEYESEVLRPEDIERIELRARAMFIRRKTGGWSTLGLALKDREEFERLIPRMREFGRQHNIKVEVVR